VTLEKGALRPDPPHRVPNVALLTAVSALLGLALAVYDNVLPLYLEDVHVSFENMGWIFSAAALVACVVRIGAGAWSDRVGRKAVYSLSLLVQAVTTLATPLTASAWLQGVLKSLRDPALNIRETLHSVLLFEGSRKGFIGAFGRTRGVEYLSRCVGLLLAAGGFAWLQAAGVAHPAGWMIFGSGLLLVISTGVFTTGYREHGFTPAPAVRLKWSDLVRPRLNRRLWVLSVAEFVFCIGLSCSHCFAMQHFFLKRFGVSAAGLLVIMALHRFFFAAPLLVVHRVVKRRLKRTYLALLVIEGVLIAVPGYLHALAPAVAVWLLHDFFGAGLWLPAQHALLQEASDPGRRGKQVSLALALGSLGRVLGPLLAGYLIALQPAVGTDLAFALPFIVGGALVASAALIVVWL